MSSDPGPRGENAPYDGPVYVADNERFYESPDQASETLWDQGREPTAMTVHPCSVEQVGTPDLREYVEENWACEYDDPDGVDWEPTRAALEAMATCQAVLEAEAPRIWRPLLKERITLPAVDCPDCGRPSNEPWPQDVGDCHYCGRPREDEAPTNGRNVEAAR